MSMQARNMDDAAQWWVAGFDVDQQRHLEL